MGAGIFVGRVGGLAVALGIGAAVLTGQGVASAQPSDTSGTESSATDSTSAESSTESTDDAASPSDDTDTSDREQSSETNDSDASTIDDAADEDKPTPRSNKRWKASQEKRSSLAERNDVESTDDPRRTTTPSPRSDTSKVTEEESTAVDATAGVAVSTETRTVAAVAERAAVEQPEASTAEDPGDPATVAVSRLVSALVSPFAGDGDEPTAPVDSPAIWTLAAAARREFLGVVPTLDKAASPVTNGLVAVEAIPQTPLLTGLGLQRLPIIGPLAVTPIVAVIHQIPLIGDILHPIVGYPVGFTGGTTPRDVKVISADGTEIYVHFFPAQGSNIGRPAPTILNGPGLGLPGETNPLAVDNPFLPNQVIGMGTLLQNGYNVVTWDPRGEWSSGGRLEIDNPDFEGRDMQAIISWVADQPEAAFDPGSDVDPLIGMVGASYGGGIQLVTAAIDPRVDAIVPTIAWNNLNSSLYKSEATKTSWGAILSAALLFTGARINPQIYTAVATGLLTGVLPQRDQDFLEERSPSQVIDDITAPTLLIQGTVDTLFTLQEAHENAIALIGNDVPTKVVWYCGGHGACITSTNDGEVVERATMDWLDKYVKGLPVQTGPQFEWVDQHGQNLSSDTYPVQQGTPLSVSSDAGGTLPLRLFFGGSGPNLQALQAGPVGALLGILSGAKATNEVELTVPEATTTTYIVGAPELTLTYSGTGSSRHVYAQLVDDTTGLVLGNHVTPIPVTLDGETHTVKIPLEMVAHTLAPGETVTLQLVASAVTYQTLWSSGELNVSSMQLSLPTADASATLSPAEVEQTSAA